MFVGLGLLIASVSFLCYKHPPWSLVAWFRHRLSSLPEPKSPRDAPVTIATVPPSITTTRPSETPLNPIEQPHANFKAKTTKQVKVDRDCQTIPPSLPKKAISEPTSPTTPTATTSTNNTPHPFFTFADGNEDEDEDPYASMPPPQFPALNSAQRAGAPQEPLKFTSPTLTQSIGLMAPPPRPGGGLMAPPRGPLPNRGPQATSSLGLPLTNPAPLAKPSKKVLLTPGHSPLDWASLTSSPSSNLRGLPPSTPYLRVAPSQLRTKTGRKGKDAWSVFGGRVYNITPYADFHPGGVPELMRSAGRDGTKMFTEVHPWVNWEGMLSECLIGFAVQEGEGTGQREERAAKEGNKDKPLTGDRMEDMD